MERKTDGASGSYNQAGFQQERLHELFLRIDRLNPCLFDFNYDAGTFNYNLVFYDLSTIFSTINSKLNQDENGGKK